MLCHTCQLLADVLGTQGNLRYLWVLQLSRSFNFDIRKIPQKWKKYISNLIFASITLSGHQLDLDAELLRISHSFS